jgi:hypothetical protein
VVVQNFTLSDEKRSVAAIAVTNGSHGSYLYMIEAGQFRQVKKMVLLK